MDVEPDRLPRWGWMFAGLVAMGILANLLNFVLFHPMGLPIEYGSITVIAAMAPVIVYVGVWYDEEKQSYWDHGRLRVASDVSFVVAGTLIGAAVALLGLTGTGLPRLVQELLGMIVGLGVGWTLFYVRNPDLYFQEG